MTDIISTETNINEYNEIRSLSCIEEVCIGLAKAEIENKFKLSETYAVKLTGDEAIIEFKFPDNSRSTLLFKNGICTMPLFSTFKENK